MQTLNGVGEECIGIICECAGALVLGLFLGFYYCWKISLVVMAMFPLLAISGKMQS